MGCLLALLARVGLLIVWLQTSLVTRAFHDNWLVPLLGIIFLPISTLAYAVVFAIAGGVTGWAWFWVVLGLLFDLGTHGSGASANRARISRRRTS